MRRMLICMAVMSATSFAAHAAILSPTDAQKHIGENATVCGIVSSAHYADHSKGHRRS